MAPSTWYVEVALYLPFAQAQQRIPPLSAALEDKESYVLLRCAKSRMDRICPGWLELSSGSTSAS